MSGLERLLILSPRAVDDFTDILQYSLETWGEAQADAYRDVLDKALLTVQDNPHIGHIHLLYGKNDPADHRVRTQMAEPLGVAPNAG